MSVRYRAKCSCERFSSMNAATFSGVTDGGHANGKVSAATSASSGSSAAVAAVTSIVTGSLHVPLREMEPGLLVDEHHVGHQVAVAVPPHSAIGGCSGGQVQDGVLHRIGRI